jgi:hypothetical protein
MTDLGGKVLTRTSRLGEEELSIASAPRLVLQTRHLSMKVIDNLEFDGVREGSHTFGRGLASTLSIRISKRF